MTLPNLISFSGYPRSGKDAAADLLVTRARFSKTYMLKPLEKSLLQMNPWIVDSKEGTIERFADLHENLGFDATREFGEVQRLIRLGTYVGRDLLGQNIWSNQVFSEAEALMTEGKKVVISGVLYPDEIAQVRQLGGVCVWIDRRSSRPGNTLVTYKDCDLRVSNDGTLRDLYVNLVTALEEYKTEGE